MVGWRFLAPVEPLLFLGVDLVWARARGPRWRVGALVALALAWTPYRVWQLRRQQREAILVEAAHWSAIFVPAAAWFAAHPGGSIALADIGYVGWATDAPILDLYGLTDAANARALHAGQSSRVADRVLEQRPRYVVTLSGERDCARPFDTVSRALAADPGFARSYRLVEALAPSREERYCIFAAIDAPGKTR
jgi:hypothetical protein